MSIFCNHIFDEETEGFIQLLKFENNKIIKIYNTQFEGLREIVEEVEGETDVFTSINTTYKPFRKVANIRQFRALYIDLDCNIKNLSKVDIIYGLYQLVFDEKIPEPSMIVDSGRGVHAYWRLGKNNAPFQALHTWQEIEDYLYFQLKHLGADKKATDGARVLRLPNTTNSRNDLECKILQMNSHIEYSMYDLRDKYLNYKKKNYQLEFQQTKKTNNKVIINSFFNSYSLHETRAEDIEKLVELRSYDIEGYRNMILHCYAYWKGIYIRVIEELEKCIFEMNNSFKEPLSEPEVKAILRCVPKAIDKFINYEQSLRTGNVKKVSKGMMDKEGYWYRNSTLIDRLNITLDEQSHLKTIISDEEKYRRNNLRRKNKRRNEDGLTKKQQELKELKEKALNLKEKGLSIREIADELNSSKTKIGRLLQ